MRGFPYIVTNKGAENAGRVVMTMSVSGFNHAFGVLE